MPDRWVNSMWNVERQNCNRKNTKKARELNTLSCSLVGGKIPSWMRAMSVRAFRQYSHPSAPTEVTSRHSQIHNDIGTSSECWALYSTGTPGSGLFRVPYLYGLLTGKVARFLQGSVQLPGDITFSDVGPLSPQHGADSRQEVVLQLGVGRGATSPRKEFYCYEMFHGRIFHPNT
jgi:hypothetical protein